MADDNKDAGPWVKYQKDAGASGKPKEGASVADRLETGFMDPVYGAAQIGARMAPEGAIPTDYEEQRKGVQASVDKTVADREKAYQSQRGGSGTDWARIAGSVANPLNYVGMLAGGLPGAAVSGGMTAFMQPKENTEKFFQDKAKDTLMGTVLGAGGSAAAQTVGKAISPVFSKAKQELLRQGVELTPGQLAGGILRRAEEAAKSFPILGSFIRGAEGRSTETFNKSVINQALAPIGEELPSVVKPGRGAIDYAHARLSNAYDQLLPKMSFTLDNQFISDLGNIRNLAFEMPKSQQRQFESIVDNRLVQRLGPKSGATGPSNGMDGKSLKEVESDLTRLASEYRHSSDSAQRQLGERLDEVRGIVRSALTRQNPQYAPQLQKINNAFAMFTRVEGAAARRATSAGLFTPSDLLATIKSADKTVRKGDFARGDALMQEYAEFGQLVLPGKLPDSGTTERAAWDMLGLGTAIIKPEIPMALGAASLPYTQPATRALSKAAAGLANPGPTRQAVGSAVQSAAPLAAPAAAESGTQAIDKMLGQ